MSNIDASIFDKLRNRDGEKASQEFFIIANLEPPVMYNWNITGNGQYGSEQKLFWVDYNKHGIRQKGVFYRIDPIPFFPKWEPGSDGLGRLKDEFRGKK